MLGLQCPEALRGEQVNVELLVDAKPVSLPDSPISEEAEVIETLGGFGQSEDP